MEDAPTPAARCFRLLMLTLLGLGSFGCDHATKMAAKASLENAAPVPIAPEVLRGSVVLEYAQNHDVAFSLLRNIGVPRTPSLLIVMSAVATIAIAGVAVAMWRRYKRGQETGTAAPIGVALVLGGALGNIVDRIVRGYVVDFIHVHGWPVFNVADIAVCVGVGLLLIGLRRSRASPDPAS